MLSHQQCLSVLIVPHLCQHLLLSLFWILAILMRMWCYLITVLICISLMTYDVVHIFMCLFENLYIFFGEVFVQLFCPFCSHQVAHFLILIIRIIILFCFVRFIWNFSLKILITFFINKLLKHGSQTYWSVAFRFNFQVKCL